MKTTFDKAWQDWIAINIERNCNRKEMHAILIANDFCPKLIENRLQQPQPEDSKAKAITNRRSSSINEDSLFLQKHSQDTDTKEKIFLANAEKIDTSEKLELFKIDNFLNTDECYELLSLIRGSLRKSTITNQSGTLKNYRTSKTCDLSLINHPLINDIDQRICDMLGFDASYSEPIQAQWYDVDQEFKPHTDYFEPNTKEFEVHAKHRGQRTWTFMLYLNNTRSGGATAFTRVNKAFLPKRGTAVIWNSLTPEGKENIESMHWGMPIEKGFKVIITKWFRLKGKGKRFIKTPNEFLPAYTEEGFMKTRLPQSLFNKIYHDYQSQMSKVTSSNDKTITGGDKAVIVNNINPLSEDFKQETHQALQPLIEAWFGHYLKFSDIKGITNYKNAAVIKQHREDRNTNIVSAVINIHQCVNKPWPLVIDDHNYRKHQVYFTPGDILFYEGAKLSHGRPEALDGDEYAELILHYQPS
jgi:prolyl 4-hydroxylase